MFAGVRVLASLLAVLFAAAPLLAQQGTVTGVVTASRSQEPIVGARVSVAGTGLGALTGDNGRFLLLNVPAGEVTVQIVRIGFRRAEQRVTLPAGETVNLEFQLVEEAVGLDAVVVTGTPGETQRRALGNALAQIDVPDVVNLAPVGDMSQLLNARAPGVLVMQQAGSAGEGGRIMIRGPGSMIQYSPTGMPSFAGDPIVYVDGIRVNSDPATGQIIGALLRSSGQAWGISRLDDFNPADFESVEIIRGPAAATLYGTEASGGVIQIITKKGRPGPTTIDVRVRQGASWFSDPEGRIPYNYRINPATGAVDSLNIITAEREQFGNTFFRTGHLQDYGVRVSGGSETVTFTTGLNYERVEGVVPTNVLKKVSANSSLTLVPHEKVSGTATFRLVVADIATYPESYLSSINGANPLTRDTPSRGFATPPEVLAATWDIGQDLKRYIGSMSISYRPTQWLAQRLTAGLDLTSQRNMQLLPLVPSQYEQFFGALDRRGHKSVGRSQASFTTVDYSGTATLPVSAAVESQTSVGAQFYHKLIDVEALIGQQFPGPGVTTISGAALRSASEVRVENSTVGLYVQQQLSFRDRLFLTGAVRGDDNSAFGSDFSLAIYPKLSASWVISEEPFWNIRFLEQLKLRAAYGHSGQQPDAFAALRSYAPAAGPEDAAVGTPRDPGNPDLGPERGQEIEIGFEAGAWEGRVGMDFTYYNQRTKDAIISRASPPSLGFSGEQLVNAGEVQNKGFEVLLRTRPIETRTASWDLILNMSRNDNKLISLGLDGLNFIPVGWIPNRHQEGYPVASYFTRRVVSAELDANGNPINVLCDGGPDQAPLPCGDAPALFIGVPYHRDQAALSSVVTLLGRLRLYAMLDMKRGGSMLETQRLLRCIASSHEINAFPHRFPPEQVAECRLGVSAMGTSLIQDAGFVKLREISVGYTLPDQWLQGYGAKRATVTAALRNLHTWTNFTGLDPEAVTAQNYASGNHNQNRLPLPMQFMTTINLTF